MDPLTSANFPEIFASLMTGEPARQFGFQILIAGKEHRDSQLPNREALKNAAALNGQLINRFIGTTLRAAYPSITALCN